MSLHYDNPEKSYRRRSSFFWLSLVLLFLLRFPGDNLLHKELGYLHWSLLFLFQHFLDINYEQLRTHTKWYREWYKEPPWAHCPASSIIIFWTIPYHPNLYSLFSHHRFPSLFWRKSQTFYSLLHNKGIAFNKHYRNITIPCKKS